MPRTWSYLRCAIAATLLLCPPRSSRAQQPAPDPRRLLDSLVSASSRTFTLASGTLQGPGAEFLVAEGARAQFVALGEQHNAAEIPELTAALLRALQERAGYHYLADEQDPLAGRLVSRPPIRGNLDSIAALARKYQHAFTFMSDQELAMLADVGARSAGRGNPVWGCDQAFGVTHVLDRLLPLVSSAPARLAITQLRDTAAARERTRDLAKFHYMAVAPKSEELARLRDLVRPASGSEADFLLQSLIVSDRVYRNYREAHYYENGYEREEYMKSRFMDEYRRAEAADHAPPKAILKFGHWHVFRGLGPSNLQTLGNFVSEFARANGSGSFHVAFFPYGDPGGYGDPAGWSDQTPAMLARTASRDQWTVVDLRPLRSYYGMLTSDMSAEQKDLFRRWIYGFDAALLIGRMHPATFARNPAVAY
jgi:hypothetical protein